MQTAGYNGARMMRFYDFLCYWCGAMFKKMFRRYVSKFVSWETVYGSKCECDLGLSLIFFAMLRYVDIPRK